MRRGYLYIIIFFLILSLVLLVKLQRAKIKDYKAQIERIGESYVQTKAESIQHIEAVEREKNGLRRERDSIAGIIRVRPREVTKVIKVTTVQRDTVEREVRVFISKADRYLITDSTACFTYKGIISTGDSVCFERTEFEYRSVSSDIFYKRRPHKLLFIHWGKWEYFHEKRSDCGDTKVESIEFNGN